MLQRYACLSFLLISVGSLCAQPPSFPKFSPPPLPFPTDGKDGSAPSLDKLIDSIGKRLRSDNPIERMQALQAMEGEQATIPHLQTILSGLLEGESSPLEKVFAAKSLAGSDDPNMLRSALETLASSIRSKDPALVGESAASLRKLGPKSESVLLEALDSKSASTRSLAAEALGEIQSKDARPKLIALLQDRDAAVRIASAGALGTVGDDQSVSPLLETLRSDPELAARANAAASLLKINAGETRVTKALVDSMVSADEPSGLAIIRAIAWSGASSNVRASLFGEALPLAAPIHASEIISHLVEMEDAGMQSLIGSLDFRNSRYWAVVALADFGPKAKSAGGKLASLLEHSTPDVQTEILLALSSIEASGREVENAVAEQLSSEEAGVRYAATLATVRLGLDGDEAKKQLRVNSESPDKVLALVSSFAVAKSNPADLKLGQQVLRKLVSAVQSGDPRLKPLALEAIKELKQKSVPPFPNLP